MASSPHAKRKNAYPVHDHAANDTSMQPEAVAVPQRIATDAHVTSLQQYREQYHHSLEQPQAFWAKQANTFLHFSTPFSKALTGSFEHNNVAWFSDGALNASVNCLDRHPPERVAIIAEGDEPTDVRTITYGEASAEVCRLANALRTLGVSKGQRVILYMPMVPEAAYAMLACARIGAIHSVVFAGFSAEALRARVVDSAAVVVITADEGLRAGKRIKLKATVDAALAHADCASVRSVLVHKRTGATDVPWVEGRDVWLAEAMARERPVAHAEPMGGEEPLFLLYTSGSTGKPKGVMHSTAGYLLWAAFTHHYTFDYKPGEVYACVADIGWITGHSYIVYGPLCNGATTVMFESLPTYPDASRYWSLVERHRIASFYTAPTAIRALMKFGDEPLAGHDRSSLRVLGSVGEPINPEAWRWYYHKVGEGRCAVVDTFWQTETGGHLITGLPGATPMKPGAASLPMFGVRPVIVDPHSGEALEGEAEGVLCIGQPWPGIARTVWGDHERYVATYLAPYAGKYFTGDGCRRDADGYLWITGRVDDVLNVSGHRLGTAEIESALVSHEACVEAAVVGVPHDIKGVGVYAYAVLREGAEPSDELAAALRLAVRAAIGGLATPDTVLLVASLPKTRSGKIMRRVLRKIACGEEDELGDVSTLAEPAVVDELVRRAHAARAAKKPC